jgi:hypothetical protein
MRVFSLYGVLNGTAKPADERELPVDEPLRSPNDSIGDRPVRKVVDVSENPSDTGDTA